MEEKDLFNILPKDFTGEDCCGKQYWKWEDKVTEYLKSQGYQIIRWETTDGDSFGPLVRVVTVRKDNITETYSYG